MSKDLSGKLANAVAIIEKLLGVSEGWAVGSSDSDRVLIRVAEKSARDFLLTIESDSDTGGEHTVDDVISMRTALSKIGVSSPSVSNEWTLGQYLSAARLVASRIREGIYEPTKETGGETCPECGSHEKGSYISGTNYAGCNVGKHHSWHDVTTPSKSVTKRLEGQRGDGKGPDFTEDEISIMPRGQTAAEISKALDMVIEERDQAFEEISEKDIKLGQARGAIKKALGSLSEWEAPESDYHTAAYRTLLEFVEADKLPSSLTGNEEATE